jgi:hypothetical protein
MGGSGPWAIMVREHPHHFVRVAARRGRQAWAYLSLTAAMILIAGSKGATPHLQALTPASIAAFNRSSSPKFPA